jgi:hypothetical protein
VTIIQVGGGSAAAAAVRTGRGGGAGTSKGKKRVVLDDSAAAAAAATAAATDFEAAKAMMGKLKGKGLAEVCGLKAPPPALRQLLHAACSAMGEGWGQWRVVVAAAVF